MSRVLTVATRNSHKLRELGRLLAGYELQSAPADLELPPEVGTTYSENALAKARAVHERTGQPAIADDSGIEAGALAGGPGVYSARYAGSDANDQSNLTKFCSEVPAGTDLRYVCVIAYVSAETTQCFIGVCEGKMAAQPHGSNGFGYDPIFIPVDDPDGRTMAQLSDREKDSISHRGRAAVALRKWLDS